MSSFKIQVYTYTVVWCGRREVQSNLPIPGGLGRAGSLRGE